MEILLAMPIEFRLTHVMRCMGQDTARKTLKEIAEYYLMTQSTFLQRAIGKATGQPPAVDPGKADMYGQCVEALRRQNFEGLNWLHHAMTVTLIDSDVNSLEQRINDVSHTINEVPFIRERIGLKASMAAIIPGQWAMQKRLMFTNAEMACDCAPVFTMDQGSPTSKHLSETCGKPMPSMAVLRSIYGTAYHLNPHIGQVGHALLVMPTGGGKTTFMNFCLTQFQRYPDAQVMIFDRNLSCRIITGQVGGSHIDLKAGGVRLNPMAAIREGEMGRLWAREFLLQRLQEGGMVTTPDDRNIIDQTILQLSQSTQSLSLSTVAHLMPRHIHTAMMEWLKDGPYGMFDSESDDLALTDWTCIEMKDIMAVERLARAFLDHAFRTIMKRLDGRPTFIYLEEASFLLNSPIFLPALDDWLKTFRKLNAFVWMTVQSPESISGIDDERIRATLADNIPNLFLGYNKRLENHRDLYKKMFTMTDAQVNLIRATQAKTRLLAIGRRHLQDSVHQFRQRYLGISAFGTEFPGSVHAGAKQQSRRLARLVHPGSIKEIGMKNFTIRKMTAALVGMVLTLALPMESSAQKIVYDPWNHSRNIITSIQMVTDEINQIKQIEQSIKANLKNVNVAELANLKNQFTQLKTLHYAAEALKGSLGESNSAFKNVEALYGAGNASNWNDFAASMAKRKALQDKTATNIIAAAENADKQVGTSFEAHQKIVEQLKDVEGVTEATQATASAVGVVVQNGQAMLSLMSATAKQQAIEVTKKDKKEQDKEKALVLYREKAKADLDGLMTRYGQNSQ
ncbi:hypothetical protein LP417_33940 (plasmid) [Polaromonas sp. P1-6]|nr:hypothetical protein LP417_33940 [Polaromonas sp. P1-6]